MIDTPWHSLRAKIGHLVWVGSILYFIIVVLLMRMYDWMMLENINKNTGGNFYLWNNFDFNVQSESSIQKTRSVDHKRSLGQIIKCQYDIRGYGFVVWDCSIADFDFSSSKCQYDLLYFITQYRPFIFLSRIPFTMYCHMELCWLRSYGIIL